ncbi:head maturation protease [Erwinia phage Faunus]|uniref:Prohead protease n=1 Tax=Erwinia phage Faunus TaxID=2182346 RepID=A0A2U8UWS8_9CAUD|nr:head maturation protease [Erwinia phage Faunus]AWN08633.1 hypothetical protein [Erwinia phage Faunus]
MQVKQNLPVSLVDEATVESVVMFADRQTIQSARVLRDSGEMIAPVTIARVGDMLYKAKELGPQFADLPPEQVVRVSTPAEVLFDEATINLCRSMPVTVGHPAKDVDLTNNKQLQKGFLEGTPAPDGSHLGGFVVLNDADTIKLVDSGVDQTSWGHDAVLERVEENGVVSAVKTKITSVNHLAIVRRGRAQTTRIGDSGEEIEIVDRSQFEVVEAERDSALVKLAAAEQKLADAQSAKLTDEEIQAIVEERVTSRTNLLLDVARLGDEYNELDFGGKSEKEIKRMVVNKLYDKDFSDKGDAYIDARFDTALEDCDSVTLGDALNQSILHGSKEANEEKRKPNVRDEALARRAARYNK